MVDYIKKTAWEKHKKILFGSFFCAIIFLSIFYIYCIGVMVIETANRNQNFQNLQIVSREYQELEKEYLSLISKLNLDYAYSIGFINGNAVAFVARGAQVAQNGDYEEVFR